MLAMTASTTAYFVQAGLGGAAGVGVSAWALFQMLSTGEIQRKKASKILRDKTTRRYFGVSLYFVWLGYAQCHMGHSFVWKR
jgi:hypothetical protein